MQFEIIPVTPLEQNCSLLTCDVTGKAVLIDPGGDAEKLISKVEERQVELDKLLITHAHFDHAGAAAELSEFWNIPIYGPQRDDDFLAETLPTWSMQFGLEGRKFQPDRWLNQGDTVNFGEEQLEVLHCPGHTPGHIVFFHEGKRIAFVGDVIFRGGIGRTDFPRGSHADLIDSINNRLMPLGEDVSFVPGHGPMSTLGEEKRSNPFLR